MITAMKTPETSYPPCPQRDELLVALHYYRHKLVEAKTDALAVYFIEMTIAELAAPSSKAR